MTNLDLLPVVSEKAMTGAESRIYAFWVPLAASKVEIARQVVSRFQVKPIAVTTLRVKGKPQATLLQRGRRRIKGQRIMRKKAYVTLAEGDTIKLFEEKK